MTKPTRRGILAAGAALAAGSAARALPRQDEDAPPGRTPHTRFAVNVEMWFRGKPFLDRIRAAADLGFPAVEFWPWQGKDVDAVAALCSELGVEVAQFLAWGFSPGLNDPANHGAFVEAIEEGCRVAKGLDCRLMTVIAGNDQPGMTKAQMHANVVEGLKRAAPVAEEAGVTMILEPLNVRVDHRGHCLSGSPDGIRICRAVDSPSVKLNWDLYHMQITEGDLCGRLREGFSEVGYIQLADTPGRNEPGTGEVHYNRVLKELHELGYRGYVGLECNQLEGELAAAHRVAAADVW